MKEEEVLVRNHADWVGGESGERTAGALASVKPFPSDRLGSESCDFASVEVTVAGGAAFGPLEPVESPWAILVDGGSSSGREMGGGRGWRERRRGREVR